jgi:putative redox protein
VYSESDKDKDREVVVESRGIGYTQLVKAGPNQFIADVPEALGGNDAGPHPYDLLLASLGTCTSLIITAAARERGWPLESVRVVLNHDRIHAEDCVSCRTKEGMLDRLRRDIQLVGPLTDEQRQTLFEIATQCPVSLILTHEIFIDNQLKPAAS